ncbi:hypothetical protein ACFPFP_38615 [Bradyrhizobium sp. GCM10023182]|uniref:Uncharacterized protein n=1 Tax=Bradyrhizobium zhengyangense TaxID=2911009 RepID=A0ABS9M0M7_9BRAD|nr:hypothetical protein [Bradyrhizobium zhengyangense]MCG2672825.1 hypothetical protein [Bradyrhizobium zhengyangense]
MLPAMALKSSLGPIAVLRSPTESLQGAEIIDIARECLGRIKDYQRHHETMIAVDPGSHKTPEFKRLGHLLSP